MTTTASKRGRGRPLKDPDYCIRRGIFIRPRFPRALHREIKRAAFEDELAMTAWVMTTCREAIDRRKKVAV